MSDWIFDNFQILALVLIAAGSAAKQLLQRAKEKREEQRRRDYGEETESESFDWEDLEDPEPEWTPVEIPPEFAPPPPPPLPQPPPLAATPEPSPEPDADFLQQQLKMQEQAEEFQQQRSKADEALQKTLDLEKQARSATRVKRTNTLQSTIRSQLSRPSTARQAILLREVLGKPVGMR